MDIEYYRKTDLIGNVLCVGKLKCHDEGIMQQHETVSMCPSGTRYVASCDRIRTVIILGIPLTSKTPQEPIRH